jgi:hypothetical protein
LPKFQGKLPQFIYFLNCFWGKFSDPFAGAICRQQQLFGQVLALAPPLNTLVLIGMLTHLMLQHLYDPSNMT